MARNISLQEASKRLTEAGFAFSQRYQRGTQGKGGKWVSGASAAEKNFEDGMNRALRDKSWKKGINSAGAGAYDTGVQTKGVANWPTGMSLAGPKYERKTGKFASLWTQPLSTPRGARNSPQNRKRMEENVARFERAKGGA